MFKNKLAAIVNKDIEVGVAMNALAHMSLGLGADLGKETLQLDIYKDAQGNEYPNISQMPFIILRGKSGEIRKAIAQAREANLKIGIYLNTMTGGTYLEQLEKTAQSPEDQLIYYGCVLFGPWETVSALTKKFSLWK